MPDDALSFISHEKFEINLKGEQVFKQNNIKSPSWVGHPSIPPHFLNALKSFRYY